MKCSDFAGSWFTVFALSVATLFVATRPAQAQTETVLYDFCSDPGCTDGASPTSGLTADGVGNFYGTTSSGGAFDAGTVFELSPNGSGGWTETALYNFCSAPNCTDGAYPNFSYVIFDGAGNLYGTAGEGGTNGLGVVFELSPVGGKWTETVLYSFAGGADGADPVNGMIFDTAGNLYGTASNSVFELSPSGGVWTEQLIYNEELHGIGNDGAGLTMDAAGNIFGASGAVLFELSPNGNGGWKSTVIHTFSGAEAHHYLYPGTPTLNSAGNLYGTTQFGGNHKDGTVYELIPGGDNGTLTNLISFKGTNGSMPSSSSALAFDAAGNIYGTTTSGGEYDAGTVYELVAPVGKHKKYTEKVLWNFNGTDGQYPYGSLILDSAGNLYGTTVTGGNCNDGCGVVFEVTP